MTITREQAANKIAEYLHHVLSLDQLVDWAEDAVMDGDLEAGHEAALRDVLSRIGVSDVREFGLTWEDCEALLHRLGFKANVSVVTAS